MKTYKDFDDLLMNGTLAELDEAGRRAGLAVKDERVNSGRGWRKNARLIPSK